MKWLRNKPQEDDERTFAIFALLPVWDREAVYWLENVQITQWYNGSRWVTSYIIGESDSDDCRSCNSED